MIDVRCRMTDEKKRRNNEDGRLKKKEVGRGKYDITAKLKP